MGQDGTDVDDCGWRMVDGQNSHTLELEELGGFAMYIGTLYTALLCTVSIHRAPTYIEPLCIAVLYMGDPHIRVLYSHAPWVTRARKSIMRWSR